MRKARNLNEFLKYVEEILSKKYWDSKSEHKDQIWFRGLSDKKYKLLPTIYRKGYDRSKEREINRDFKLYSIPHLGTDNFNEFEYLFIGRHHGLPTRLMDWSKGSFIGLFFAVKDNFRKDGMVWLLHAMEFNEILFKIRPKDFDEKYSVEKSIPISSSKLLENYRLPQVDEPFEKGKPDDFYRFVKAWYPIAIRPSYVTSRIVAQKGFFTVHGKKPIPLERLKRKPGYEKLKLENILIPANAKKRILLELKRVGFTQSSLFPDLDGLGKEINDRYLAKGLKKKSGSRFDPSAHSAGYSPKK